MSKCETEMTLWYWNERGGTLIEEFMAVQRAPGQAQRLIDGLIVLGEEKRRPAQGKRRIDLRGRDVVANQTKNSRLGMYLMGQTLFTLKLLESMGPAALNLSRCARLRTFECVRCLKRTRGAGRWSLRPRFAKHIYALPLNRSRKTPAASPSSGAR